MNNEQQFLLNCLEEKEGPKSLIEQVRIYNKGYLAPHHLAPIAELFHRIMNGERVFALTSVPPRHSKSMCYSNWCAHYLKKFPNKKIGYITYESGLARKQSRICKQIAAKLGVRLDKRSRGFDLWRTEEGGYFYAVGRGGAITGWDYDLIIVDDPIKDRKEAESSLIKEHLIEWFNSVVLSRIEPQTSIIVNGTRWALDDLHGRLLDENADGLWEVINLPAINEDGSTLWPERFPIEELQILKNRYTDYEWESLYQGQPVPKSSVSFRSPTYYPYANAVGARWIIGVDVAGTSKNYADYSVVTVACATGIGENQVVDVIYQWAGQVETPELIDTIKDISSEYSAPIYIESNGLGKGVAQMLRKIAPSLHIYEKASVADKFTRALPLIAAWNGGKVRIPEKNADWTKDLLKETRAFSPTGNGTCHDDRIDSLQITFDALNKTVQPMKPKLLIRN